MINNTPLRYPGGKSILFDFIAGVIEDNNLHECHYAEPYCGGAGAALNLLFNEYVPTIAINDADKRIYQFWLAATKTSDELIRMIEKSPITVKEWEKQKNIYNHYEKFPSLQVGFSTLFLNRCNYSGILNGGIIGGIEQTGEYKIDARFKKEALIEKIRRIGAYRSRIELSSIDGIEFIKNISKRKHKTLLYIDPPYYEKGKKLYKNWYSEKDHKSLQKFLITMKKGYWILSYDSCDFISNLYSKFNIKEVSLWHSAGKAKRGKELIIHSPSLEIADSATTELNKFLIAA